MLGCGIFWFAIGQAIRRQPNLPETRGDSIFRAVWLFAGDSLNCGCYGNVQGGNLQASCVDSSNQPDDLVPFARFRESTLPLVQLSSRSLHCIEIATVSEGLRGGWA